jgi:hypothetical protein
MYDRCTEKTLVASEEDVTPGILRRSEKPGTLPEVRGCGWARLLTKQIAIASAFVNKEATCLSDPARSPHGTGGELCGVQDA